MNNKMLYIATFAIGATIGSVATWHIVKKKYERKIQEEIDSVKEAYAKLIESKYYLKENNEEVAPSVLIKDGMSEEEVEEEIKTVLKYNAITDLYKKPAKKTNVNDYIFTISPEEFAENDDYQVVCLSYFEDDRLADVEGNLLDIANTVGHDALTRFGEYEDDVVHVRNTMLKTDYEILLEPRTYSEAYPDRNE